MEAFLKRHLSKPLVTLAVISCFFSWLTLLLSITTYLKFLFGTGGLAWLTIVFILDPKIWIPLTIELVLILTFTISGFIYIIKRNTIGWPVQTSKTFVYSLYLMVLINLPALFLFYNYADIDRKSPFYEITEYLNLSLLLLLFACVSVGLFYLGRSLYRFKFFRIVFIFLGTIFVIILTFTIYLNLKYPITQEDHSTDYLAERNRIEIEKPKSYTVPVEAIEDSISVEKHINDNYFVSLPSAWNIRQNKSGISKEYQILDENNRLVMIMRIPIREIGYEGSTLITKADLDLNSRSIDLFVYSTYSGSGRSEIESGFALYKYNPPTTNDWFDEAFEVEVPFKVGPYSVSNNTFVARYLTQADYIAHKSEIEAIIGSLNYVP